ncbi:PAS domain S-box protein [Natronomonas halophila]|uniref:PAS domain S-box protein n=1 Tax=Natronomonas halophila TaxID=2747817 RepID=UPI0015B56BD0|nr:PAS domain S-box protein [Natronomonas halophila]QLD86211.1 PAS domain S-box protein [Natronomonas halophila]
MDREARGSGDGFAGDAADGDSGDWLRERRVSDLLANVPGMVYRCRNERGWPMAFVSEACAELTGYDPAALEGDEVSWGEDVIAEDERETVWETVQSETESEGTFSVTYRIETAGGESRWVRDDGRGIFEDGTLVGIEGVIVDITERKRLESELDEVFGRVSDAFFALDEEWRFTYLNERAHELINPEGRQLAGKDVWEEFPDALGRKFKEKYERAMYEQETVAFEEYYPGPLDRWFEVRAYPSETGLSVYFRDVTERKEREQELERYETIVETIPDGAYVLDEDHRFVALNGTFAEMTGYDREELLGRDAEVVSTERGHERGMELREKLRAGDIDVAVLEEELEPSDGESFDVELRFTDLRDDDGTFRGTAGAVRDITERKERQRELELFRNLLDRSSDAVLVSDPETGRILDVNDTAARRLNYDREDLLELTIPDIETEMTSQADWHSFIEDLRAEGRTTFRGSHERQDGSTFPVEVNVSYVELNREYVLSMARDVTERKEYERELQRKERRYEAVFEDPNILVGLLDPDGTVLDINRTAMEYVDADLDAVTGEPFWETPWWGDSGAASDEVREWVERAADGEYVDFEADLARPDGEQYAIEGYFRPVTNDEGEVVSIIVSDRDVTERKRRERALEENERRYRALAEHFPNGIVTLFDHDYEYTLAAGRGFETISSDPADLEGRTFDEVWDGATAERLRPALESALDGEERSVELDYEGREWILHAAPVTDEDGEVFAGMTMAQDLTERRAYERRLEESEQRLQALNRLNEVVRDISDAVIEQSTRDEIEQIACERLAESDSYEFAWVGETDPAAQSIDRRAMAGVDGYLDDVSISIDADEAESEGPTGRALRTGEIQTLQHVRESPEYDPWRGIAEEYGFRASAAIPIRHEDTVFGVLNVYTDRPDGFEQEERTVIDHLGEILGHAIASVQRKQALMSDTVVELELGVPDVVEDLGVDIDRLEVDRTVPIGDGAFLVYGRTESLADVEALVESLDYWEEATAVDEESDPVRFQARLSEPPMLSAIAGVGGSIERAVVTDGDYRMTVHLPESADVRTVIDTVQDVYPQADALARRQVSASEASAQQISDDWMEELTDRQLTAIEVAYFSGFFEWPRGSSGEEVAESLGVSSPTFHQHVRSAERKLFDVVLSEAGTGPGTRRAE